MVRKFDYEEAKRIYEGGASLTQTAAHFNIRHSSLQKAFKKLGVSIRTYTVWDKGKDQDLIDLYVGCEWGVLRCSNYFDVSERVIHSAVKRLGVLDSSRQFKKVHTSNRSRAYKRKQYNFSRKDSLLIYKRDGYVCKWCKKLTSPLDRTIHHVIPVDEAIKEGWAPDEVKHISNGECFHKSCHMNPDVFPFIHNGRKWAFGLSQVELPTKQWPHKEPIQRSLKPKKEPLICCMCGDAIVRKLGGKCSKCTTEKFTDGQLLGDLGKFESASALARFYDCSEMAIRHRMSRLGLPSARYFYLYLRIDL